MTKRLKLKFRKIWGLIPTFVEVTGEKLVGGFLPTLALPPFWIGLKLWWLCLLWYYKELQTKCITSETKSHVEEKNKDVEGLLNETRTIQKRLLQRQKPQATEEKAKIFTELVLEGKVKATIWLLDDDTSSGVLPLLAYMIEAWRQINPMQNHQLIPWYYMGLSIM